MSKPTIILATSNGVGMGHLARALGLDLDRPVALVQLGTGDNDINHKMTAALAGFIHPHKVVQVTKQEPPIFGDSTKPEELRELIKSATRFEHLISGASTQYRARREAIAKEAYGDLVEVKKTR